MSNQKCRVVVSLAVILLFTCKNKNEDVTNTVDKLGSVETALHIAHIDSLYNKLVTTHKVSAKNNVFKTVEYSDTIPSLGNESAVAENSYGDTKNVSVKKD